MENVDSGSSLYEQVVCALCLPFSGRPPYGYRVCGPGDEAALRPDPLTAPVVQRIFAEYVSGHGLQVIAERLTAEGILRPSAYDPQRNPHHIGSAWSKVAVRAIITNVRYAAGDAGDARGDCVRCGRRLVCRKQPALVPIEVFQRAQTILAARSGGTTRPRRASRYVLRGLLRCELCQRLMQGTWNNHAAYYRCRFPREYARANNIDHPANIYLREDRLVEPLLDWICGSLPAHLRDWANGQPQPVQVRLVAQARALRKLVDDARQDPAQSVDLYSALGMRLVYKPGHHTVQVRSEVLPGVVFLDDIML